MADEPLMAELADLQENSEARLDDGSIGLLARLRTAGVRSDGDWERITSFLRDALHYLAFSNKTEAKPEEGKALVNIDADPHDADWICIVRAYRLAGDRLPTWAALWALAAADGFLRALLE